MTAPEDTVSDEKLEVMYTQACLRLLEATEFGRLALVENGKPVIVVLNHLTDGDDVLFRTRGDALIAQRTANGHAIDVVYEVDSAMPIGRSGWSVIATGQLSRETDPAKLARAAEKLRPWAEGDRDTVLRLTVSQLGGRKVGPA
jgi:nitroimidazol reductase NimA-like FMN-containing flavoprotein (pyridoxamine 5'-phosphate oxidase superfamily)